MSTAKDRPLHRTDRDTQIILMTYHYEGIVSFLIRKRFWGQNTARSPFYDRLARLIKHGYLRSTPLPAVKGSGFGWITLGAASHPLLREYLGLTTADLRRFRHSYVPLLHQHSVLCRTVRLCIEMACAASFGLVSVTGWLTDGVLQRQPIKVSAQEQQTLELVPDGIFSLALEGAKSKQFYLEVDRGTMTSPNRFKARLAAYLLHLKNQPAPVLIVVPDPGRRAQLFRWIQEEATRLSLDPGIFAIALEHDISEQTVLSHPIWHGVDSDASFSLLPAATVSPVPRRPMQPDCASGSWFQQLLLKTEGSV